MSKIPDFLNPHVDVHVDDQCSPRIRSRVLAVMCPHPFGTAEWRQAERFAIAEAEARGMARYEILPA